MSEFFDFLDMSVNQSSIGGIGRGRGIRSNPNSGKYQNLKIFREIDFVDDNFCD